MEVSINNGELRIKPGFLQSELTIPIASINSWELVVDDSGNPYVYFSYNEATQGIALPKKGLEEYQESIEAIQRIIGLEPVFDVSKHQNLIKTAGAIGSVIEMFVYAVASNG